MTGVEIDMVVPDSLLAFGLYHDVFDAVCVEKTAFERGLNEAVFTIAGVRFHLLDENPEYQLYAPKEGSVQSMWLNVVVEDIEKTIKKAEKAKFLVIQSLKDLSDFGVKNAIFSDPFGYVWMLHEIVSVVSFEDRTKHFENEIQKDKQ